jgi:hypothetical protein
VSCEEDHDNTAQDQIPQEPSWMKYSPLDWSHDGEPFVSTYCIVYSDGASYEMKNEVGSFVDDKFLEILGLFNFRDMEDLRFPPGYDKIDIYINMHHEESIAYAYWGSIFMTMRSSNINWSIYDYLFKHELTHVFEFLIEGNVNLGTDIWFSEGIAIYNGGGLNGIENITDLNNWITQNTNNPGQGNPICIHEWDDFPPEADIHGYYCNVFDLTMRYLVDPGGLGKSREDVLKVFYDIRNEIDFPDAFHNKFGISLTDFESEYFDQMRSYLNN